MVNTTLFRQLLYALFLSSLLTGCGGGGDSAGSTLLSGIQGRATQGPLFPLTQPGQIDNGPLPGAVIIVQRQNGAEIGRQTANGQGDFKIAAAPGTYQVVGLAPKGNSGPPTPPAPQIVNVKADQYLTVNVSYDTGIR